MNAITIAVWALGALAVLLCVVIGENSRRRISGEKRLAMRLASIERRLGLIMEHVGVADPPPALPEVVRQLEDGNKIRAIKAYREATGAGLKEARVAVEAMARERGLNA